MKRERRWFQIGAGLVLFLSFVVFAGCAKVYVNCPPPEAMKDNNTPPTGPRAPSCNWNGGTCTNQPSGCVCR